MKHAMEIKRKRMRYECDVCGERANHSQQCCGHPMIELITKRDILNWKPLAALEKFLREESVGKRGPNTKG